MIMLSIYRDKPVYQYGLLVILATLTVALVFPETFAVVGPVIGGNHLTPLTLLTPFLFVAFLLFAWRRESRLGLKLLDLAVAALVIYMALRNLFGADAAGTLKYVMFFGSLYYVTAVVARTSEGRRLLFDAMVVLLAVVALYGLIEYIAQSNIIYHSLITKTVPPSSGNYYRIGSTLAHPISLAAFILQALPFSMYWWLASAQRWRRYTGAIVTLVALVDLFFTFTRSSMAIAVVAGIIFVFMLLRRRKKILVIAGLVFAVTAMLLTVVWFNDLAQMANRDSSYRQRQLAWDVSLDAIAGKPVIGAGYGQAAVELRRLSDKTVFLYELTGRNVAVDNQYLATLVEGGFLQFVLLLSVIVVTFLYGYRRMRSDWSISNLVWPPLAGIVLLLINAILFDPLSIWSNLTVFWFEIGLIRGISVRGNEHGPASGFENTR